MKVLEYLDELNLPYVLNPRIVRGLDYYNRTVFEYWAAEDIEGKNALGGGGRYDGLVGQMGGRENTPACGWALGLDRIVAKLREKEISVEEVYTPDVFIAQLGESAKKKALVLYESLRRKFKMAQALYKDSLKAQLEIANRMRVKYTLIIGQKEITDGTIMLRDMNGASQEIISLNKVESELAKRLEKYTGEEGVAVIDTEETKAAMSSKKRPDYGERVVEESNEDLADLGSGSDESSEAAGDDDY
jgi:histidyl-tRNA synthetase